MRVRLRHIDELTQEKVRIAQKYMDRLSNRYLELPVLREQANHVWHQFVLRSQYRDELIEYLQQKEIGTIIHYPIPPHLSKAYEYLGHKKGDFPITENYGTEVLSLPMYNGMTEEEQNIVIKAINEFR